MAEWLRQLLPLVVGVAGLSVLCPHAHSTHVYPFFSLTHSSLVSLHSHAILVCCSPSRTGLSHGWSVHPHAEVDGLFILPMACGVGCIEEAIFPSRAGWYLHAEVGYVFLVFLLFSARLHSRIDWLGCSIHVRAVLTVLLGLLIPNMLAKSPCSGTVHSFHCFYF